MKKVIKPKHKVKEVITHGVQSRNEVKESKASKKEQEDKVIVRKRVLVSNAKLALRILEGWKVVEKQGDLTLIEKEI